MRETNSAKWETQYDFPAVQSGDVEKSLIPHGRPSGMTGLVMNTRRDIFQDWRVREAMIQAFNFEFINQTLNAGDGLRITSYFSNSVLGMQTGPAEGRVAELLAPFASELLPGALEGYALPVSNGTERNRANINTAMDLMAQAGWTVQDGVMADANGNPFSFEILLDKGSTENQQITDIYSSALRRLGIEAKIDTVDSAQMTERTTAFDYDMIFHRWGLSLSPGNEQFGYWGSESASQEGSRNRMGVVSPAIDAMINEMLTATSGANSIAATRALDRVLTSGRYVIPVWHNPVSFIAHAKELEFPENLPVYGDWIGFQPDVWWYEEN